MRSFLGVSIVLLGLAACGGGVSVSTNAGNVCSEVAEVACHNLYQCCAEGEIEDFLNVSEPRTEPQCKVDITRTCERNLAKADAALEAKRARFDSDVMNRCLEALVAPSDTCATVDTMVPWAEECMDSAWVGLVPDGAQCFATFECAGTSSFCATNQICVPRPTTGQPCTFTSGCATGNFCQAGTCQLQLGAGQSCTSSTQCQKPLFCDIGATMPVCTEVRDAGQPCTSDQNCKSGQCIPGTCSNSTAECFRDTDCSRRCTNNGFFCTTDSNCGTGTCSTSGITCSSSLQCTTGETCNFPVRCVAGPCIGSPVCTQAQIVVDYCDAVGVIDNVSTPATN